MIFETLQQHGVEAGGSNDLADGKAGKTVEQVVLCCISALLQQELGVIIKARDKIIDMVSKPGVLTIDMWQVWNRLIDLCRLLRPHCIGVDVRPYELLIEALVRDHPANRENIVLRSSAIRGKQADHRYRVGNLFPCNCEGLFLGSVGRPLL